MLKPIIECREGWKCLYEPIIHLCTIHKVSIFQIKEKFGGLRVYTGDIPNWLLDFIDSCETASCHICEKCGQAAEQEVNHGWLSTLCKKCRKNE